MIRVRCNVIYDPIFTNHTTHWTFYVLLLYCTCILCTQFKFETSEKSTEKSRGGRKLKKKNKGLRTKDLRLLRYPRVIMDPPGAKGIFNQKNTKHSSICW